MPTNALDAGVRVWQERLDQASNLLYRFIAYLFFSHQDRLLMHSMVIRGITPSLDTDPEC